MTPRLLSLTLLLTLSLLVTPNKAAAELPPKRFEIVQYGPHKRQRFYIWHAGHYAKPHDETPRPVLVYFFGGGFVFGSPGGGPFRGDMLKNGVTVVAGGYRFRQDGATKREILEDGARIIQYLRLNARRLNVDRSRIGVAGYSSGGVVAGWVALHGDLRDADNPDPLLRQSSRVSVCCLDAAQVHPVDLDSWERYTGSPLTLLRQGIYNFILLRLYGEGFVQPFERDDFMTAAAYEAALWDYQQDVFIFYQASRDDPPVCFYCNQPDDPDRYARRGNGGGLHSPLLMIPLERRLQELGVPVFWGRKKDCR
ncbi:MAG: alpha/beta hydrolase fold domain-containing protein, partial [Planctomycetaceae bacterium]|nr:alpha/beta hydrolase fold domain-containing protein [Planctomycetaceae bacterium]